jgi:O-antigen ligase
MVEFSRSPISDNSLIQQRATEVARWAVLALCFTLGFSRALFALSTVALLLSWSLSGRWRLLAKQSTAWGWASLILWMYASIFWSDGSQQSIAYGAGVHWQLLLIPIIATLIDSPKWMRRCWQAFSLGISVVLFHVFALLLTSIPWETTQNPAGVFYNPLPQSIALAIFFVWCLEQLISGSHGRRHQAALIVGMLLAAYAVLQVSQQRLGYLALFCGSMVILAMRLPTRQRVFGLLVMIAIASAVTTVSPNIKGRLILAGEDIKNYEFKNNYSSLGSRLHMWHISTQAVREAPVLGHGLGSYPILSEKAFNDANMCAIGCLHPHNLYLFYASEFGLIGLGIFCIIFLKLLRNSWRGNAAISVAVLIVFGVTGLADTTLWYRGYLYLFVPLLGLASAHSNLDTSKFQST